MHTTQAPPTAMLFRFRFGTYQWKLSPFLCQTVRSFNPFVALMSSHPPKSDTASRAYSAACLSEIIWIILFV
ncbi:hypothetical protein NQ318_009595 [Aromia moschata]|uniref:Uncharacterized protein n=1 Tax=Aromia moschata TaxID=1265417 RepID=A0AAV8XAK0_9CUCU|nr:hypothetical protein NQ318_009595 [Aromia moschata]